MEGTNQTSRYSRDPSGNINGVLRIVVTDDGAGISAVNQARLFHEVGGDDQNLIGYKKTICDD